MAVLEAKKVSKTYHEGGRSYEILKDIDLCVDRGEVVALEGRSGSGKTTLLSILGCIMQPTSGKVILDGHEVEEESAVNARREYLGFVFQNCNLIPALTAQRAIDYVLRLKGLNSGTAWTEANRLLELVGLGERVNHLPRDLSGGEKQRVAIARAMAGRPAIILADEPTANLDSETAREILALFRELAKTHSSAVVIVTHDYAVRAIADRVLNLDDGVLGARVMGIPVKN